MIGVDTNVVVRILSEDDSAQVRAAVARFLSARTADDPAYISAVVLTEAVWVLRSKMGYSRHSISSALAVLLDSGELRFEHADRLRALLEKPMPAKVELTDYLIAWCAESAGCSRTVTFDRRAAKSVPGMELLA